MPRRIEILFWETVIYLAGICHRIKKVFPGYAQRKMPLLLSLLIICSGLAIGIPAGLTKHVSANDVMAENTLSENYGPTIAIQNHQSNILLIQLNDLNSTDPTFDGIWLVLYTPGDPELAIIPIHSNIFELEFLKAISNLNSSKPMSSASLYTAMRNLSVPSFDVSWKFFIVTDRRGIYERMASSKSNRAAISGSLSQASVLNSLCLIMPTFLKPSDPNHQITSSSKHILTNLEHTQGNVQPPSSYDSFYCRFSE